MLKRRKHFLCGLAIIACCLTGCGNGQQEAEASAQEESLVETEQPGSDQRQETGGTSSLEGTENITSSEALESQETEETRSKILVAYFTRLPNTESGDDLDAVVQGGGPYGAIGENFANADLDAISSASVTVIGEEVKGNVETLAEWIAAYTGGELFSIETVEKYPLNYSTLIDQGGAEQRENFRPELATQIENIDDYSIIYLGYPNWYYDMPMALYSFLEEYDLSGKTIVPFVASAGSGFSDTISSIEELQPEATVIHEGIAIRMGDVKNSEETVKQWIDSLGLEP